MNDRRWTTCVFLFLLCAAVQPIALFAQEDFVHKIHEHIQRLQSRYQISFRYADFPVKSEYLKFAEVPPSAYPRLSEYLTLFEEEINKYPSGFFKDQDVRGIGIVMRLFGGEKAAQGLYSRAAGVMFFDMSRFANNKAQQRHSIHHEIFHMMVGKRADFYLLHDAAWGALNAPDFVYGPHRRMRGKTNPLNYYAPDQPGFVTDYAMESVVEDQAEVFACLMQAQHRNLVEQWAIKDEILAKKIAAIKEFAKAYHPQMDEEYWNK